MTEEWIRNSNEDFIVNYRAKDIQTKDDVPKVLEIIKGNNIYKYVLKGNVNDRRK